MVLGFKNREEFNNGFRLDSRARNAVGSNELTAACAKWR